MVNFPVSLPGLKNDFDNADPVASADQNDSANEVNAIGAKVGINSSATTTSHDYKLSGVTGTDKAVSKTGTETLTGKTLTSPTITGPTVTGTIGGTPTITTPVIASFYQDVGKTKLMTVPTVASDTLVTLAAEQTLTTKTLTTPVLASFYQDAGKTKLMTTPNTASDTLAAIAATQALTNKTLTTPILASFYQDAGKTKLMTTPNTASDTLSAIAATQTLTNKRVTKRIGTTASSATPTPASDDVDVYTVTALAEAATFGAPSGTPTNGQGLIIRILDNGTARALSFNAIYRFSTDLAAPTTTVLSKTMYLGFLYNSAATKWDCVAILNNF